MTIKTSFALVAAIALIAGPAMSQDAATQTPAPAETPAADAPAAGTPATAAPAAAAPAAEPSADAAPADAPAAEADAPAAEADAPATPADDTAAAETAETQVGQYYLREEHGDWMLRCMKVQEGRVDPCELYQLMRDPQGNAVAEIMVIPLLSGQAAAGATLVAPLETDLTRGLGFGVDAGEQRGYPFSVCNQVGCISRIGFTAPELAAIKNGRVGKVTLMPFGGDPEQPINLDLSLTGFTAAFDSLSAIARENQAAADAAN